MQHSIHISTANNAFLLPLMVVKTFIPLTTNYYKFQIENTRYIYKSVVPKRILQRPLFKDRTTVEPLHNNLHSKLLLYSSTEHLQYLNTVISTKVIFLLNTGYKIINK